VYHQGSERYTGRWEDVWSGKHSSLTRRSPRVENLNSERANQSDCAVTHALKDGCGVGTGVAPLSSKVNPFLSHSTVQVIETKTAAKTDKQIVRKIPQMGVGIY